MFVGHSMGGLALIGMLLRRYNETVLLQQSIIGADDHEKRSIN